MDWVILSLGSALLLGVYDIFKKRALIENAVIPTLFCGAAVGAALWAPAVAASAVLGAERVPDWLFVDTLGWRDHLRLALKACIVAASWTLSYFGLKALPVSVAGSVRATGPLWTLAGALVIFGERPSGQQWAGIAVTLASFYALSLAGRREGLSFGRDKGILLMILGTLAGAASGLYDKHLLGGLGYRASTVQAWFSIYMVAALLPLLVGWLRRWWPRGAFQWRWAIPFIGISLLLADYLYFTALRQEGALVGVISAARRGSVLVTFLAGYLLFGERNYRRKTPCLAGILIGIALIALS